MTLDPVLILKFIRDTPLTTTTSILDEFARGLQPNDGLVLELERILDRLVDAKLVQHEPITDMWVHEPILLSIQTALRLSLSDLARSRARSSHAHLEERILVARTRIAIHLSGEEPGRASLLVSLGELGPCLRTQCYSAVVALAGKILEITLRRILRENSIELPKQDCGLGTLVTTMKRVPSERALFTLEHVAQIIRAHRNPAVHATSEAAASAAEAEMVVYALLALIDRSLDTEAVAISGVFSLHELERHLRSGVSSEQGTEEGDTYSPSLDTFVASLAKADGTVTSTRIGESVAHFPTTAKKRRGDV